MRSAAHIQGIGSWIASKFCLLVVIFLALGVVLSGFFSSLRPIVNLLLAINMFSLALNCRLSDFRQIGRLSRKIVLILLIIYGLVPLFALTLGKLAFPKEPGLAAGFVLISILPVAISSAFWTETADGNLPLTFSIVALTTLLSGALIPGLMRLYVGKIVQFDASGLVIGLIKTVMLPVLIGIAVRHFLDSPAQIIKPYLDLCVKGNMLVIIAINAAVIIPHVQGMSWELLVVILVLLAHITVSYTVGYCFGYLAFPQHPDLRISIAYTSGMRNSSAGIAIALAHFPPLVAVPVILSILFQQPIAALAKAVIEKRRSEPRLTSVRAN